MRSLIKLLSNRQQAAGIQQWEAAPRPLCALLRHSSFKFLLHTQKANGRSNFQEEKRKRKIVRVYILQEHQHFFYYKSPSIDIL